MGKDKEKTIETVLRDKSAVQLKGLVAELAKRLPDAYDYILLWSKSKNAADFVDAANDKQALENWEKAETIIDDFNSYGGGPEDDEDEAFDCIEQICALVPELSWETRKKIMDGMLVQYHYGNSGLDDMLTDACFQMCQEREEWLYLAERLLSYGGRWDNRLVMNIYKAIGDTNGLLKLQEKNLQYGSDYFELVEHYAAQGDIDKAVSYAREGLNKGQGRVDHIVQFLFEYYEGKNDAVQLEDLFSTCEDLKKECLSMSGRLFEYYKARDNYENTKKYLLKEFEYFGNSGLNEQYEKMKGCLNETDWAATEEGLFAEIKERDIFGYLQICLSKGLKQEVLETVVNKRTAWGNYDYFADKLKNDFPEKIIEYYLKIAISLIENGANRKSYASATKYINNAKTIYIKILKDVPRWEYILSEMKERYKKRKAFLEELQRLN